MSIRCFKCGWAWSMNASEVAAALDSMHEQEHTKHYMAECPKCRRVNKVPIKQLRRYAPRDWKPGTGKAEAAATKSGGKPESETASEDKA